MGTGTVGMALVGCELGGWLAWNSRVNSPGSDAAGAGGATGGGMGTGTVGTALVGCEIGGAMVGIALVGCVATGCGDSNNAANSPVGAG